MPASSHLASRASGHAPFISELVEAIARHTAYVGEIEVHLDGEVDFAGRHVFMGALVEIPPVDGRAADPRKADWHALATDLSAVAAEHGGHEGSFSVVFADTVCTDEGCEHAGPANFVMRVAIADEGLVEWGKSPLLEAGMIEKHVHGPHCSHGGVARA